MSCESVRSRAENEVVTGVMRLYMLKEGPRDSRFFSFGLAAAFCRRCGLC